MHRVLKQVVIPHILLFIVTITLNSQPPSHDPTHMVKDGDRYWIYTTGAGIWNMSSPDPEFSSWRAEPLVFPSGTWPSWINNYVSGFDGNFWATEIIYMNGQWHLYYSCSSWGSQRSAIGVVTSPSLSDPDWQDQGMVVHSDNSKDWNAIDPDIFKDNDGKVWLLYGSYWDGIFITELDSTTGKPINPDSLHHAANNRCEAGHLESHGDYYYLFFNRGACCDGIHSTYHILMGRSTSPTGPFYDKDSVATNNNGGTLFLHSDGRILGPGHFALGEGKLTYHYYDGARSGAAKLKVAGIEWGEDGWPIAVYTRAGFISDGTYVITNYNSKKVLEHENGDTLHGTNVIQNTETGDTSQHWEVTYLEDGYYRISPVLAVDKALHVSGCNTYDGANVQIGKYEEKECQQWYIAYMGGEQYRIMARHSRKALEIINAYTHDGANAQQWPYNEHQTQRWTFKEPAIISKIGSNTHKQKEFNIYPNPSLGNFKIDLANLAENREITLEIYSIEGKLVYNNVYENTNTITFSGQLDSGAYQVKINTGIKVLTQKLVVK
ncbi:MAG: family 43 glycosylhydrolase [Bacteroidales bacterium]|nr:MAG: family 43 glycosylhydrolase [Bacteroidales bacterium]